MIGMLRAFLEMDPERQSRYQVGRRLGLLSCIRDMDDPRRMSLIDESYHRLRVTPQNVDEVTDKLVTAYI